MLLRYHTETTSTTQRQPDRHADATADRPTAAPRAACYGSYLVNAERVIRGEVDYGEDGGLAAQHAGERRKPLWRAPRTRVSGRATSNSAERSNPPNPTKRRADAESGARAGDEKSERWPRACRSLLRRERRCLPSSQTAASCACRRPRGRTTPAHKFANSAVGLNATEPPQTHQKGFLGVKTLAGAPATETPRTGSIYNYKETASVRPPTHPPSTRRCW